MRRGKAVAACAAVAARTALFGASLLAFSEAAAAEAPAASERGSPVPVFSVRLGDRLNVDPPGVVVDVDRVGDRS